MRIDLLDLPGLTTTGRRIDLENQEYLLEAQLSEEETDRMMCPQCGIIAKPGKWGKRPRDFRDSPIRDYRVLITLRLRRFRCNNCGIFFMDDLPGIDPSRRMTIRCVRAIRERSLRETFVHVGRQYGCDEKTVRNIAKEYIWQRNEMHRLYLPKWLGIDEIALRGRYRCVLTDVANKRPIDMLPDRELLTMAKWLEPFNPDFCQDTGLEAVMMDMWKPFRQVIKDRFPGVPIIVDRFHVVRMANSAVDSVRNRIASTLPKKDSLWCMRNRGLLRKRYRMLSRVGREKLDRWLSLEPDLATAYHLKEEFFGIYDFVHKHEAARALDKWTASIPEHMRKRNGCFYELLTATKNWKTEILAFFDVPVKHATEGVAENPPVDLSMEELMELRRRRTNAYTESLNSVTRVADRAGRGYNFDVLRARVLFGRDYCEKREWLDPELVDQISDARIKPALKWMTKPPSTDDVAGIEKASIAREIAMMHDALLNKYGHICADCCGQFEAKLLTFYRLLPRIYYRLVAAEFNLFCTECQEEFYVSTPELLIRSKMAKSSLFSSWEGYGPWPLSELAAEAAEATSLGSSDSMVENLLFPDLE